MRLQQTRPQPAAASRRPDPELQGALQTLDALMAGLSRRHLDGHPRARALARLRDRMKQDLASRQAPEQDAAKLDRLLAAFRHAVNVVVDLPLRPDERAAHHRILLDGIRKRLDGGDRAGAERRLRHLVRLDPADAAPRVQLGRLLLDSGRLDEAREHLEAAIDRAPRDPAALLALGELYYRTGNMQGAATAFGKAQRVAPALADAHAWLGLLAHEASRPEEAQRLLERAVALEPGHAAARFYLAQVSLALGDTLRARFQLDIVRKLEPAADLARFESNDSAALPARTGWHGGWIVPKASGR